MESFTFTYLGILLCTPLLTLLLNATGNRSFLGRSQRLSPQVIALFSLVVGFPIMGFIAWAVCLRHLPAITDQTVASLYGTLVYGALAYAYFHLYNLSETARRFRILYELSLRGKMTRNEISTLYRPTDMLATRLERLVAMRQLKRRADRYALQGKFLYGVSKILRVWASLLGFRWEILK